VVSILKETSGGLVLSKPNHSKIRELWSLEC